MNLWLWRPLKQTFWKWDNSKMTSYLETVPRDVLQHIAFLLTTPSVLEPPRHLIQLLLTSSTIYKSLNVQNCPHLYANIFRTKFDFVTKLHNGLTDSELAAELLCRCRVLRRARRRDLEPLNSRQDLFAALRMTLENRGTNEAQLLAAGFPNFIMTFVRRHLSYNNGSVICEQRQTNALAIWLLCFTLTHQDIAEISVETQEEIIRLLHPSIESLVNNPVADVVPLPQDISQVTANDRCSHANAQQHIIERADIKKGPDYYCQRAPTCPDPVSAAIILIFALKEALILGMPMHVPENRAIAIASQRSGPTMEDFRAITLCKTPLFAETRRTIASRVVPSSGAETVFKKGYDSEFCQLLQNNYNQFSSSAFSYTPGTLTGLWEGCFMISGLTEPKSDSIAPPFTGDFSCRKPMQCAISEYLCFSPHLPLPMDDLFDLNFSPVNFLELEDGFEVHSRKFGYEKYLPPSNDNPSTLRDPSQALDIVILGETLHDHEQAWGGFRFAGRIRADGLITIKREPKNVDDGHLGTWIFEGRLRYGAALVGQLRSSISTKDCHIRGIFSLHKTSETW